jgi:hypothetical protein
MGGDRLADLLGIDKLRDFMDEIPAAYFPLARQLTSSKEQATAARVPY